jgi:hypothetical protein
LEKVVEFSRRRIRSTANQVDGEFGQRQI